jgi:hypothetical protein
MALNRTDLMVVGGAILIGVVGYQFGKNPSSDGAATANAGETAQMRDIRVRALVDCKEKIASRIEASISDIPYATDSDAGDNGFLFKWDRGTIMAPGFGDQEARPVSATCSGTLVPLKLEAVSVNGENF